MQGAGVNVHLLLCVPCCCLLLLVLSQIDDNRRVTSFAEKPKGPALDEMEVSWALKGGGRGCGLTNGEGRQKRLKRI